MAAVNRRKSHSFDRAAEHSVVFDWYRLDSWDGETFRVWLNGQQVLQSPGFSGWAHIKDTKRGTSLGISWEMVPDVGSWGSRWGRRMWNEQSFKVTLTIPANWASTSAKSIFTPCLSSPVRRLSCACASTLAAFGGGAIVATASCVPRIATADRGAMLRLHCAVAASLLLPLL